MYNAAFELAPSAAQKAFSEACDKMAAQPCDADGCADGLLARPNSTLCFIPQFHAWHNAHYGVDPSAPAVGDADPALFHTRLQEFAAEADVCFSIPKYDPTTHEMIASTCANRQDSTKWTQLGLIGFIGGELKCVV